MKKFRFSSRSGSEKSDVAAKASHISIPHKDPIAILPPKKVIKALYDYQVQDPDLNPGYLSFAQGDFLHVVGRENDTDWYDACNPLQNTRGLVPVNYFEGVDKKVRTSDNDSLLTSRTNGGAPLAAPHDSGQMQVDGPNGAMAKKRASGRAGSMVYGMVLFDFKAERPDELEATAGEAIIVIAQSNPEWFVAKPITRLGGPGLIPVSFIEIRDTATGKPVEDTQEAVRKAGVPSVEEWKRMAAEYKNSSVSLGKLNFNNGQPQQGFQDRNSFGNARSSQDTSQYGYDGRQHERNSSAYAQGQYFSQQQSTRNVPLMSPIRARVPGYLQRGQDYTFTVQALMEDGRAWTLQRSYKDFYGLQLHLIEQFPEAAGRKPGVERTLPLMPGPLPWVTERLTKDRCGHLNVYLHKLLKMTTICQSHVVRGFFYPKEMDEEIQPPEELKSGYRTPELAPQDNRLSDSSQQSGPYIDSGQSSSANLNNYREQYEQQHRQQQQQQQQQQYRSTSPPGQGQKPPPNHYRSPSELRAMNGNGNMPPPMLRNNSAMTAASANSASSQQQYPPNGAGGGPPAPTVKIKVWFGDSNCVVIRLPSDFNYNDLVHKLRGRWSLEPGVDKANAEDVGFDIEYRDEETAAYYRIISDDELSVARERNEKLTLRVNAVSGMM